MTYRDACAVILAGGLSSRMGFNKALIRVGGRPLIGVLADRVRPLTGRIFVASNDPSGYRFLNVPVIPDVFSNHGPLAGIHAVMTRHVCSLYIVLACDLPNLQEPLLRRLMELADGFDAVIPRTTDGVAHWLCAVYRKTCLPSIEKALETGANKVALTFLGENLSVRWVDADEGHFKDTDLANLNTPQDLQFFGLPFSPNAP